MLLAIDTATKSLGIGLHDGHRIVAECTWSAARHHTVLLAPEVGRLMLDAGLQSKDLDGIGVAIGPGSYTGLRIGTAFAKGLAMSEQIPLIGIPTFDIIAFAQAGRSEPMFACIQAGRSRIAGVWYKWSRRRWKAEGDAVNTTWSDLLDGLQERSYICGEVDDDGLEQISDHSLIELASPTDALRRPGVLAQLAWERMRSKKRRAKEPLTPVYLDPDPS